MNQPRPEVRRIAHLLGVPPERVAYLDSVPDEELRSFGKAVNDLVVELARVGSVGVGRLAKVIPVSTAAKVAEKVGSPLMVARLAYFNDPQWASKMAEKLSPELIASAVTLLDAETTAQLLDDLSEKLQFTVLDILVQREEWVVLGELFGALPEERVRSWSGRIGGVELDEIRMMVPAHRRAHVENAMV